jgi:hypothetical protein
MYVVYLPFQTPRPVGKNGNLELVATSLPTYMPIRLNAECVCARRLGTWGEGHNT